MAEMWTSVIPLAVASAFVPIQIVVTVLLLRADAGRLTAVAWVAGLTSVRLAQGLVFGLVLTDADATGADAGPGPIASSILLVAGVLFLVSAVRALVRAEDPDAPPPRWLELTRSLTPLRAFALGAGSLLIGVKFWVFTLGAIAAIEAAEVERAAGIAAYLVFVALAITVQLTLIAVAYLMPSRADAILGRVDAFLTRNDRWIVVGIGLLFGTWFVVKALDGLGVL